MITEKFAGKQIDGVDLMIFKLKNDNGVEAKITNYGGTILSLMALDRNGKMDDIVLGYDTIEDYVENRNFFGALVGRCGNRIKGGKIGIHGEEYQLTINEGKNQLHGGIKGFDRVMWSPKIIQQDNTSVLQLEYLSKDGEEGYPGNLSVKVIYSLSDSNELKIQYSATTDKDTVVNLTNHTFFNLKGHDSGDILDHELRIDADGFTPADEEQIPTGEIRSVEGTALDFTQMTPIGIRINNEEEQLINGQGYDHNWVLNNNGDLSKKVVELYEKNSGRLMEVYTTAPGIQFYSGNLLNKEAGFKDNATYDKRSGLCLETQNFPDAIHHENFPSPILHSGEEYSHTTIYKLSIR